MFKTHDPHEIKLLDPPPSRRRYPNYRRQQEAWQYRLDPVPGISGGQGGHHFSRGRKRGCLLREATTYPEYTRGRRGVRQFDSSYRKGKPRRNWKTYRKTQWKT